MASHDLQETPAKPWKQEQTLRVPGCGYNFINGPSSAIGPGDVSLL